MAAAYDRDPAAALADALRIVLGTDERDWSELVAAAGFEPDRTRALVDRDLRALDALFRDLNEMREIDPYPRGRWIDGGS